MAQDTIMPLWPNKVPNQEDIGEKETDSIENIRWVRNVQHPSIEVYLPSVRNNTGKAVLIFPGGGYSGLAYNWEGVDFAKALNAKGVAGIVVKSRLPISKSIVAKRWEVPLQDAQRAIRLVRSMAKRWNIDSDKVGAMGFSAGGHLTSSLGVHYNASVYQKQDAADNLSARPDFLVLAYPVISFNDEITHNGSRRALLGEYMPQDLIKRFSNELQVDSNTPPTFLIHATDDRAVVVENSLNFFRALRKHDVQAAMHIYPTGGHGFGMGLQHPMLTDWLDLFLAWMNGLD